MKEFRFPAISNHNRSYAGLFLLCLSFGLLIGLPIARRVLVSPHAAGQSPVKPHPNSKPATGQQSWLILGVDDFRQAAPEIRCAWLALFFPGSSQLTLVPILPARDAEPPSDQPLLDQEGFPSRVFLEWLQAKRIWWTGTLVLDVSGFTALVDAGHSSRDSHTGYDNPLPWYSFTAESGDELDQRSSEYLEIVCQELDGIFFPSQVEDLVEELGPHLQTNLDLSQIINGWPVSEKGQLLLDCEFPMLGASR